MSSELLIIVLLLEILCFNIVILSFSECRPHLQESLVGTFRIFQPGSSIATSLVDGESASTPKHFGQIEIRNDKKFRLIAKPYTQIRPFLYRELSLQDVEDLNVADPKIDDKIKSYLNTVVQEILLEAKKYIDDVKSSSNPDLKYRLKEPSNILVRIRVDPAGYATINQQRFGSQFVGKVANPGDMIVYSRKRRETNQMTVNEEELGPVIGDVNKINVEELVSQALESSNRILSILPQSELGMVLRLFQYLSFLYLFAVLL